MGARPLNRVVFAVGSDEYQGKVRSLPGGFDGDDVLIIFRTRL